MKIGHQTCKNAVQVGKKLGLNPCFDGFVLPISDELISTFTVSKLKDKSMRKKLLFLSLKCRNGIASFIHTLLNKLYLLPKATVIPHKTCSYLVWKLGYRYSDKFLPYIFINKRKNYTLVENFKKAVMQLIEIHFPMTNAEFVDVVPYPLPDSISELDFFTMKNTLNSIKSISKLGRIDYKLRLFPKLIYVENIDYASFHYIQQLFMLNGNIYVSRSDIMKMCYFYRKFYKMGISATKDGIYVADFENVYLPTLCNFVKKSNGIDKSYVVYSKCIQSFRKAKKTFITGINATFAEVVERVCLEAKNKWLVEPKDLGFSEAIVVSTPDIVQ